MPKLSALIGGLLVLTSAGAYAQDEPHAVQFEVGRTVEITLAKPYRTAEGVRVHATSTRLADKDLFTLAAGGREVALPHFAERGCIQGVLTAVDDAWLTLDLGEKQPLLRIPRAVVALAPGTKPLHLGRHVRFVSTELGTAPLTGHLLAIDTQTLLVKLPDRTEPVRVPRPSIERLEVLSPTQSDAEDGLYAAPFEVGQTVEITLAKPYRSAEGIRVQATSMRLADKDLLTLAAGGREVTLPHFAERGCIQGVLTAVDDAWLTLDLGDQQPLLLVPRAAIADSEVLVVLAPGATPLRLRQRVPRPLIERLEVLPPTQSDAEDEPYAVPFEIGQRVEITLAKPYRTTEGVRVHATSTRLADRDLFTLAAGGREVALPHFAERGYLQGVLTAVDDAWLTLDLGELQPLLRIPRTAMVGIVPQGAVPLPPGQRIRVVSRETGGQLLTGCLLAIDEDALFVKVTGRAEPLRLRRASIEQIEVSHGKHSRAGKGALIGGVALGIPGALVGWYGTESCVEARRCTPGYVYGGFASAAIGGVVVGGAIGALIGSASGSERWERVPLSVAIAPQRRGGRAELTLRF